MVLTHTHGIERLLLSSEAKRKMKDIRTYTHTRQVYGKILGPFTSLVKRFILCVPPG